MVSVDFAQMSPVLTAFSERFKDLRPEPVYFYPYLKRVLETAWEKEKPQFPMDIKIPKENKYLLKKDFEPAQIIHLEEPVRMSDGTPIWFENTMSQAYLRFGYDNMDARYISQQKFDMEFIHGFLGGSSGHGKSVTINSMLASLFYEYAPWELEVNMSDAKIIEFKKYGVGHIIPHIKTIAATEDADFVLSVLQKAFDEMNQRAKIFANIGASNLKSFRKMTGLAYPRVLIVMDEVESTFKMAGKLAGKIADLIDGFARLGRAAGYHIFMATQNMSSDIPKSATGQIRNRMCLGSNQATSEAVLGNGGASENFGRIGRLVVNTEVLNGGDTYPANVKYQTPFLSDDDFNVEMEELERLGQQVGYHSKLSFYDEEDIKTLATFDPVVDKSLARMSAEHEIDSRNIPIVLGYPAFVSDDKDGLLKIVLNHKDIENIVLCSSQSERLGALIHIIEHSAKQQFTILHYSSDIDMFQYTPNAHATEEARDAMNAPLSGLDGLVRKRLFLAYADGIVAKQKNLAYDRAKIEKQMRDEGLPEEAIGNALMCTRAVVFNTIAKDPAHATMWKPVAGMFKSFKDYYRECVKYKAIVEPITVDKFSKVMYFLGDLSKIIGWGRDNKSSATTSLKKLLQDANRAAVVFVIYTRSLDSLNDLNSGLRYGIFDSPDSKDWVRMRTEAPPTLKDALVVLYDSMNTTNPQRKFKRTLLKEEF